MSSQMPSVWRLFMDFKLQSIGHDPAWPVRNDGDFRLFLHFESEC